MKIVKLTFLLLILICTSSCRDVQVAENINQYQAHQIINKLSSSGIDSKYFANSNGKSYSVSVAQRDYLPAVSIIAVSGILPKVDSDFKELTEPKGFLSSNKSFDLLRLDRAIAVELEDALLGVPSITNAKVVVRLNSLPANQVPSVSIVAGTRDQQADLGYITDLVKNSIPGIQEEHIKLILERVPDAGSDFSMIGTIQEKGKMLAIPLVPFLIWQVPSGVELELAWASIAILVIALLVGYFLATIFRKPKLRERNSLSLPESNSLALGLPKDLNEEDYR